MSLPKLISKGKSRNYNLHTNPPSTRVSLPTDTAEHAPVQQNLQKCAATLIKQFI